MAILKHFAVKNADYGAVIDYLKYQHDEFHLVPILDENGNSMLRDEFYFDGLNCNPEAFDLECELLNQQYHKNQRFCSSNLTCVLWLICRIALRPSKAEPMPRK